MMEKKPKCQIARIKPSVENVIPYNHFKKTQPRFNGNFSALNNEEYIILFGGGRDLILGSLTPCSSTHLSNQADSEDPNEYGTDLFILNSCIVIWFNGLGYGLEIPYSSVLYHASRRLPDGREGLRLEILLTLERDEVLNMLYQSLAPPVSQFDGEDAHDFTVRSVELTIRPKYSIYDRHYNNEIETLFTFENFGVNRGDDLVNNCNEALAVCMDLHGTDVQDQDQDQGQGQYQDLDMASEGAQDLNATYSGLGDTLHAPPVYQNDGLADDLDGDLLMDNVVSKGGPEASMSMEFYANQNLAGKKNFRDE